MSEEIESIITDCLTGVLGREVDPDENFTDYNLDSILLNKIYNQLQEKFPSLSVADLFEYPNINLLADYLGEISKKKSSK